MKDFGRSWRDGVAFNAMIYNLNPELVDLSQLPKNTSRVNLENAFTTAEVHLGIPRLLDPEGNTNCCCSILAAAAAKPDFGMHMLFAKQRHVEM